MDVLAAIKLAEAGYAAYKAFLEGFNAIRAGASPEQQTMLDSTYADFQAQNRQVLAQLKLFPDDPK